MIGFTTPPCVPAWKLSEIRSSKEAAMRFKADEIVSVLETEIKDYESKADAREVGRVLEVGDGIARIYGLSGVMSGEVGEVRHTGGEGRPFNWGGDDPVALL